MIFNNKNYNSKLKLLNSFGQFKGDYFEFRYIEEYFRKKNNSNVLQVLSDKTCNDLDFNELFMFIDRTNSKIGQQYLYNKLRTIPLNPKNLSKDEKLIEEFTNNAELRLHVQKMMSKLNNDDAYYITTLFQDEHLKPPKWFFLVRLLSLLSFVSLLLILYNSSFVFLFLCVFTINSVVHYWNKKNLYQYLNSLPQLLKLSKVARELYKNENFREINTNIPKSLKIIDKMRNRMVFFKIESKLQGDLNTFIWGIMELLKIAFLLEPLFLFGVLKQLDSKRKEIEDTYKFVGQIDSLISIASLRKGLEKFCLPDFIEDYKKLSAKEVYHPLIDDCVKNSININTKSVLLTGSNMSGKTTFIRTIGLNVITGLTINTCFADYFSFPVMRLFSAIRISDDLMNDRSYYFNEVLTIKEMIDKSNDNIPNLFLLDEIFKGTNTVERISAGKAVLSYLTKSDNIVFVSTHDIELAELLQNSYELYHFSEIVGNKTVDFDYKLKEGKLKNRNAIRILQINDYPESIIKEAIDISKELDNNVLLKAL